MVWREWSQAVTDCKNPLAQEEVEMEKRVVIEIGIDLIQDAAS